MDLDRTIRELSRQQETIERVVASLKGQKETIERVIASLRELKGNAVSSRRGRKSMPPEERRVVAARMKAYWAARRRL
jgi:hypothetical protein